MLSHLLNVQFSSINDQLNYFSRSEHKIIIIIGYISLIANIGEFPNDVKLQTKLGWEVFNQLRPIVSIQNLHDEEKINK